MIFVRPELPGSAGPPARVGNAIMGERTMTRLLYIWPCFLLGILLFASHPRSSLARTSPIRAGNAATKIRPALQTPPAQPAIAATQPAGQHDFDFLIGAWKVHLRRLQHPLTGSHTWIDIHGADLERKIWHGRANLEEFEGDGPTGHLEGLALRLYNPQSQQWSIYWANGKDGVLGQPMIGAFQNGRGEFFDQEPYQGRAIYVRFIWSDITPTSCRFEQAFSPDGGQTWETNWVMVFTRDQQSTQPPAGR